MTKVIDLDNDGALINLDLDIGPPQLGPAPPPPDDAFRSGMLEQSGIAQMAESPIAVTGNMLSLLKEFMMGRGPSVVAHQLGEIADRVGRNFDAIPLDADPSTQRGAAAQTLLSAVPGVGRYVEPMRESIPSDPRQPIDVGRVAGNVAGGVLDATVGAGVSRLGGVARGAAASRAAAAERAATEAAAKPALAAMADDLSRVQRTNATLGVTARDLDAGGFDLSNRYRPTEHLIEQGIDAAGTPRPDLYTQLGELMETFKKQKQGQLRATSNAASADEVRAAVRTLRPALKEARRVNAPYLDDMQEVYRNLARLTKERKVATKVLDADGKPLMTTRPAPFGPTLTGTDLNKVIRLVDGYIKKFKGNEMNAPLTAPLMAMRSQLNKLLTQRAGIGTANRHLRELGRTRRPLKRTILKDAAAGPSRNAVVVPPEGGMNVPAALRAIGDVGGMVPGYTGATIRYGARGGARITELLEKLLGKGASR